MNVRRSTHLSVDAASLLSELLVAAAQQRERVTLALSGGATPLPVFERLASTDLPWDRIDIFQVDERVAAHGDPARNLTHLDATLGSRVPATVHAMDVTDPDLDAAARRYADQLPDRLDVVHLGVGDDGHTASLVPGDPVLDAAGTDVAVTGDYRGHRRMTLTLEAINRAVWRVWIVSGESKRQALDRLLAHDPTVPAGRVTGENSVVITDLASTDH